MPILKSISYILNWIPNGVFAMSSRILGFVLFRIIRFRRDIVLSNLRLAFGPEKSEAEIVRIAEQNYQHYIQSLTEVLQSISWGKEQYLHKTSLRGLEHIEPLMREKKGGVFLGAHLGNWEFAVATAAVNGVPVDVVVKKAKSRIGQMFLDVYRNRFGVGIFFETQTVKEILSSISGGRFTVFILDQFMGPPIGVPVHFFGKEAGTAAGLALFCEKRDIPVFPAYNYRDSTGRICTVIEPQIKYGPLSEDRDTRIYQRTQTYNEVIESLVRRHPEQWLWLHRRWKEFRGKSRWTRKVTKFACLSVILLCQSISCTSQDRATPTGIVLPPDPQIAAPVIKPDINEVKEEQPMTGPEEPKSKSFESSIEKNKRSKLRIPPVKEPNRVSDSSNHFHVIPSDKIPFEIGERVEMDLRWLAIPAGKAVLEVKQGPQMNGRPTFHLWGNVLSSKIVDTIYHVDNTAESFVDTEALIPYKFLLHMVESKQNKETRVAFDHVNGKAYYWAKRTSERWGPLDLDRTDVLIPQAKDLWSAIYYARYLNYKLNEKQKFVVYENGQNWEVELTPVANELVISGVGAFQCWKILVKVSLNNVLKPMGDVYMWLSDDSKKHLVKFDAKIKIGSLYGVLTSIKEH
jgi:Kdo2-lipid IVA lauroyltransferase/acyltransferase